MSLTTSEIRELEVRIKNRKSNFYNHEDGKVIDTYTSIWSTLYNTLDDSGDLAIELANPLPPNVLFDDEELFSASYVIFFAKLTWS